MDKLSGFRGSLLRGTAPGWIRRIKPIWWPQNEAGVIMHLTGTSEGAAPHWDVVKLRSLIQPTIARMGRCGIQSRKLFLT